MRIRGDIDRLQRLRIQPCIIHAGRNSSRRRVEILYLFRHIAKLLNVFREGNRISERASGVGRHEIGDDELFHIEFSVYLLELFYKCIVDRHTRFSHLREHVIGDMFRSNAKLPAHMILAQLPQKCTVPVRHHVVEPDSGADENLFHLRQIPKFSQQLQVIAVVDFQIGTRLREEALAMLTCTDFQLFRAGGFPELCCRTADIVDVPFKIRVLYTLLRLREDRLMAPRLDNPAFVEGQGTEIAVAVAAAVGGQREFDFFQRGYSALSLVGGMIRSHVGQGVHIVHLLHGHGLLRRVLYNIQTSVVSLDKAFCGKGIGVFVLDRKTFRIRLLVCFDFFKCRQSDRILRLIRISRLKDRAADKCDIACSDA